MYKTDCSGDKVNAADKRHLKKDLETEELVMKMINYHIIRNLLGSETFRNLLYQRDVLVSDEIR